MKEYVCENCGAIYTKDEIEITTVGAMGWGFEFHACPHCGADHEEFGKLLKG